jgi:hypothetical protein
MMLNIMLDSFDRSNQQVDFHCLGAKLTILYDNSHIKFFKIGPSGHFFNLKLKIFIDKCQNIGIHINVELNNFVI